MSPTHPARLWLLLALLTAACQAPPLIYVRGGLDAPRFKVNVNKACVFDLVVYAPLGPTDLPPQWTPVWEVGADHCVAMNSITYGVTPRGLETKVESRRLFERVPYRVVVRTSRVTGGLQFLYRDGKVVLSRPHYGDWRLSPPRDNPPEVIAPPKA